LIEGNLKSECRQRLFGVTVAFTLGLVPWIYAHNGRDING
jgi:hypothetical protein